MSQTRTDVPSVRQQRRSDNFLQAPRFLFPIPMRGNEIEARVAARQQAAAAVTEAWKQKYEDQEQLLDDLHDPAELFTRAYAQ